jgi:hypothetical protein
VLRGAFEQRAASYQQAINSGWMKPSEVRAAENLPAAGPEADKLYIQSATIPMEVIAATPPSGTDVIVHPQPVKMRWLRHGNQRTVEAWAMPVL